MRKLSEQLEFIPPYCPNPHCLFHFGSDDKSYAKNGIYITDHEQEYFCGRDTWLNGTEGGVRIGLNLP